MSGTVVSEDPALGAKTRINRPTPGTGGRSPQVLLDQPTPDRRERDGFTGHERHWDRD